MSRSLRPRRSPNGSVRIQRGRRRHCWLRPKSVDAGTRTRKELFEKIVRLVQRAAPMRAGAALLVQRELDRQQLDVETMDANSLKRLILTIEKQINANMALRMKYSDQPERFMESELELYQALKGLHAVAASPELYPVFVKTKCVASLLGLLAHENADIANDVLDLIQEMTGAEDAAPEDLLVLVDALLQHEGARQEVSLATTSMLPREPHMFPLVNRRHVDGRRRRPRSLPMLPLTHARAPSRPVARSGSGADSRAEPAAPQRGGRGRSVRHPLDGEAHHIYPLDARRVHMHMSMYMHSMDVYVHMYQLIWKAGVPAAEICRPHIACLLWQLSIFESILEVRLAPR